METRTKIVQLTNNDRTYPEACEDQLLAGDAQVFRIPNLTDNLDEDIGRERDSIGIVVPLPI
jgi:hypothetical protein